MFMKKNKSKKRYDTKEYIESFLLKCFGEIKLFLPSLNFKKSDNAIKINGTEAEDTEFYLEIDACSYMIVTLDPKISSYFYGHFHPLLITEPYNENEVKGELIDALEDIMKHMSNRYRVVTAYGLTRHQRLINGVWKNDMFDIFAFIIGILFFLKEVQYKVIGRNYVLSTEDDHNKLELFFKKLRKEIEHVP